MQIINNRYRVINQINQNPIYATYYVNDIKKDMEQLELTLINPEHLSENLKSFYIDEFINLTNIEHSDIIKLHKFGTVRFIDNKLVKNNLYYFTRQNNYWSTDILEKIKSINQNEILDVFSKISEAVHYLHKKGFVYGEINLNNIMLNYHNGGWRVTLKDLATIKLETTNPWLDKTGQSVFKAPELLLNYDASVSSDIYSLGVLLLILCKINVFAADDNKIRIEDIKQNMQKQQINDENKKFIDKIILIVEKMIEPDKDKRYRSIDEYIKDINSVFNKEYKSFKKPLLEKLSFKTKMSGRKYELEQILNVFESVEQHKAHGKWVFIHGETGIGKTRLLKEIKHVLRFRNTKVYYYIDNNKGNNQIAFAEILKNCILECDKELIEKYKQYLCKLIPELDEQQYMIETDYLSNEKEKLKFFNNIYGFVSEFVKGKTFVVLIDDIHLIDDLSIEIMDYIYTRNNKNKNVIVVAAYNDGEYYFSQKFSGFLKKTDKFHTLDIPIHSLNDDEAGTMVKNILGISYVPKNFSSTLNSVVFGNPLFLEEAVKYCFNKGFVYVDDITGNWATTYDDYREILIPSTLEQILQNQIKELDGLSLDILTSISIFKEAVLFEVLEKLVEGSNEEIKTSLQYLISRGIICKKIEDKGFAFDFNNKVLKNLIYSRVKDDEKKNKHQRAADILEENYIDDYETNNELITHLEMAGNYEGAIKYCIKNAEKMEKLRNRYDAIKNYSKAISLFPNNSKDEVKIELLLKIGKIYYDIGNVKEAYGAFDLADKLSSEASNYIYKIDALNLKSRIYMDKNDMLKVMETLNVIDEILKISFDLNGHLDSMHIKCVVAMRKGDYTKTIEICKECLEICPENLITFKGKFHKSLGDAYVYMREIDKAVIHFDKSLKYFEMAGDYNYKVMVLNNIGGIYADYYMNDEEALRYFLQVKEISEANHILKSEILALTNIASTYCSMMRYDLSYIFFKESIDKSINMEFIDNLFYCYIHLCEVCIKIGSLKEANNYYKLAKEIVNKNHVYPSELIDFYAIGAELFYQLGDMDKTFKNAELAIQKADKFDFKTKWNTEIIRERANIIRTNKLSEIKKSVTIILSLSKKYVSYLDQFNIILDLCLLLYDKKLIEMAVSILNEYEDIGKFQQIEYLKVKYLFLKGILSDRTYKLKYLINAIEVAKQKNIKQLLWKINFEIGNYYLENNNYFNSINYYFESCENVRDLLNLLPNSKRIEYIKFHKLLLPFNKIRLLKQRENLINLDDLDEAACSFEITKEDIDKILGFEDIMDILSNRYFVRSAMEMYDTTMPFKANSVRDIIANIHQDPLKNLEWISKYLAKITLATRCLIVQQNIGDNINIIASSNGNLSLPRDNSIFKKVSELKESIILTESQLKDYNNRYLNSDDTLKSVMCIPILLKFDRDMVYTNRLSSVMGYIYLESDRVINNFNQRSLKKCKELTGLVACLLDKYNLILTSNIDKLTGVYTRKYLEDTLELLIQNAEKMHTTFSLIMFDIDHFKKVNDTYGHQTGDEVLSNVCKIIMNNIRRGDMCYRYGGEEFIVVLPCTDSHEALDIAERLRCKIEDEKILGSKFSVTASMGIATYPTHGRWRDELIEKVDKALYVAKESGRNRCILWNEEYSGRTNGTDKLTGIITGNPVQDSRNVLVMVELIDMIKNGDDFEEKIYNLLGRIVEITESQYGMLFLVKDNEIDKSYCRKVYEDDWVDGKCYNEDLVQSIINSKQGIHGIDWDKIIDYDSISGLPNFNSVVVLPLLKSNELKGILYLTVPSKSKEYKSSEYNYIKTLGDIVSAIL